MKRALGLYVHWPFCARICPYCDFNVYRDRGVDADDWARAFAAEIAYWAERIERRPLRSLSFGGGTPSLAPARVLAAMVEAGDRYFGIEPGAEISIEANPNDVTQDRLAHWKAAGVNRLSIGVQSFHDDALKFLGRDHDAAQARRAVTDAVAAFENVSFDLIYAYADHSSDAWRAELAEALALNPAHLSLYQLTIEPGTAFARAVAAGRWTPPDGDKSADLFDLAQEMTAASGLDPYEISNHARPGFESRHNFLYWRQDDYIGIGPGAHGRVELDARRTATETLKRPDDYLARVKATGAGLSSLAPLSDEEQLTERLAMGLRLAEGVTLYADDVFYDDDARVDRMRQLIDDGLLEMNCGRLVASKDGRRVLNRLLYELLG
ncbi:MAG: radical SAM family heme chaperone HemW [Pseudomonadota bacterium]